jgi:hypothetical protein
MIITKPSEREERKFFMVHNVLFTNIYDFRGFELDKYLGTGYKKGA